MHTSYIRNLAGYGLNMYKKVILTLPGKARTDYEKKLLYIFYYWPWLIQYIHTIVTLQISLVLQEKQTIYFTQPKKTK